MSGGYLQKIKFTKFLLMSPVLATTVFTFSYAETNSKSVI